LFSCLAGLGRLQSWFYKKAAWADSSGPFFLPESVSGIDLERMPHFVNWLDAVERTVTALGYDLVDSERAAGGLLRVYIDRVPGRAYETGVGEFVTVDDCEKVTRQLQHVLEVEGAAYERLEVSSPGLDRPLKREADFERFAGENVALTLKMPFKGRKKFQGELQRAEQGGWRLVLDKPEQSSKAGNKKAGLKPLPQANRASGKVLPHENLAAGKVPAAGSTGGKSLGGASASIPSLQHQPESGLTPLPDSSEQHLLALDFTFDEVREARLVPELDFKGRRFTEQAARQTAPADAPVAGDHVDGGRDK
jgi:ribosome maturation factor RimP